MPQIKDKAIVGNAIALHILPAADTVPVSDDGNGYGQNNAGGNAITEVSPLVELGDLEDSWNVANYHDYGSQREQIIRTFRGVQELDITIPWRPSEAAQAAIITSFNTRTTLIFAFVIGNGNPATAEDQITFTAKIISRNDMLSAKEDRMTFQFKVNVVGDVAYAAVTT